MHELSIAMSLIELALEEAEKNHAGNITKVELEVGALSGVDATALEFAISLAAKQTRLAMAEFVIIQTQAEGECSKCNLPFIMQEVWTTCPECNAQATRIISGDALRLISLTIDD